MVKKTRTSPNWLTLTLVSNNLPQAALALDFSYDLFGNLTSKLITKNTSPVDLDVSDYAFGVSGKPHRLSSVTIGTISNTLSYDANGNITIYDAASGDDRFLSFDGQNNVTAITVGTSAGATLPTARDEFWVDPDHQRFLGRESWNSSGVLRQAVTVYLGSFEEVVPEASSTLNLVQRTQLTDTVRHVRSRNASTGVFTSAFQYFYRDHLGSLDVVTNSSGTIQNNKVTHDPFGGRRNSTWAADITSAQLNTLLSNEHQRFSRGFTDHEQLNRTGFIHMNGRVYDPRLGRFVSADPFVQAPFNSQSYNRYAYTFNNPLSNTDPSGFGVWGPTDTCMAGCTTLGVGGFFPGDSIGQGGALGNLNFGGFNPPTDIEEMTVTGRGRRIPSWYRFNFTWDFINGDLYFIHDEPPILEELTTVEMRWTRAAGIPGARHAYLFLRAADGREHGFRAGPDFGANGLGAPAVFGGRGLLGQLFAKSAPFDNSLRPDYLAEVFHREPLGEAPLPFSDLVFELGQLAQKINDADIPYNPLGPNSNTAAAEAARAIGLTPATYPIWTGDVRGAWYEWGGLGLTIAPEGGEGLNLR